jgi:hypothetical protein
MNNKKLVIHLIREELRNQRLMRSLEDLGFDCLAFNLDISREILELAGFQERSDELYQWYFGLIDKALEETTYWNLDEMLDKWSAKIYIELLETRLKENIPSNKVTMSVQEQK